MQRTMIVLAALLFALLFCPAHASVASVFTGIYEHKVWSAAGGGSGAGSTLAYTIGARHILDEVVSAHNITSIADVPCGSFHWMKNWMKNHSEIDYTGIDIVDLGLASQHAGDANLHFLTGDISAPYPLPPVDLVLSRDALQHLPLSLIFGTLRNVRSADPRFFLVGSYPEAAAGNADIPIGEYFPIDLARPPFSLGAPEVDFPEHTPDGKHLYLYTRAQMRAWQLPKHRKALVL